MKRTISLSFCIALSLSLGACSFTSSAPQSDDDQSGTESYLGEMGPPVQVSDLKTCLLPSKGKSENPGLNKMASDAMNRASKELQVPTIPTPAPSTDDDSDVLDKLIEQGCTFVVGIGHEAAWEIEGYFSLQKEVQFLVVNDPEPKLSEDIKPLSFEPAQASFLAGYAAAAMTTTGKVGTFLGSDNASASFIADGFAEGISAYNNRNGTAIELIGWSTHKREGEVVDDPKDKEAVKKATKSLLDSGADVVMPISSQVGTEVLEVIKAKENAMAIWHDVDGAAAFPDYAPIILTSVLVNAENSIFDIIKLSKEQKFDIEEHIGDLKNGGVGLAPWHEFEKRVPEDVKKDIQSLSDDLTSN